MCDTVKYEKLIDQFYYERKNIVFTVNEGVLFPGKIAYQRLNDNETIL